MLARITLSGVSVMTPSGRHLFDGLNLRIDGEHVALVGRNGVGKSTLLSVIAGDTEPHSGQVKTRSKPYFLPQTEARARPLSLGERRRQALLEARRSEAEILLLDEPSEHLDEPTVSWLVDWLGNWPGCVIVASHDRRILQRFRHFFIVSESGCRYFHGTLAELDTELEREHDASEWRYVQNLHRLATHEAHTLHVARRKARKKRHGRCSELDRATPRILLNAKRSQAQVSHGRLAKLREARLASLRQWTQSTRRALKVSLPLELALPELPDCAADTMVLHDVSARTSVRQLFSSIELQLGRSRVAVVGPNGSGKTTLIEIALGKRVPDSGSARCDPSKIGVIEQGGANWLLEESLLDALRNRGFSEGDAARRLLAHRFPLALGERPLHSLSPGERARAALISLFSSPQVELLVLDEPTFGLDLLGQRAVTEALRRWPGGLLVTSHDRDFLAALGANRVIQLGESRATFDLASTE